TAAASASDGTLPTVVARRKWKSCGMIAGFSETGTERTPAVHAPSATKLMWPNESTPELPMKRYSATTIATLTRALMKHVGVACETRVQSKAAATTSTTGPLSCTSAALHLIRARLRSVPTA